MSEWVNEEYLQMIERFEKAQEANLQSLQKPKSDPSVGSVGSPPGPSEDFRGTNIIPFPRKRHVGPLSANQH